MAVIRLGEIGRQKVTTEKEQDMIMERAERQAAEDARERIADLNGAPNWSGDRFYRTKGDETDGR